MLRRSGCGRRRARCASSSSRATKKSRPVTSSISASPTPRRADRAARPPGERSGEERGAASRPARVRNRQSAKPRRSAATAKAHAGLDPRQHARRGGAERGRSAGRSAAAATATREGRQAAVVDRAAPAKSSRRPASSTQAANRIISSTKQARPASGTQAARGARARRAHFIHRLTAINYRITIIYIRNTMVAHSRRWQANARKAKMGNRRAWRSAGNWRSRCEAPAQHAAGARPGRAGGRLETLFEAAEAAARRSRRSSGRSPAPRRDGRCCSGRGSRRRGSTRERARDPALARLAERGDPALRAAALAIIAATAFANGDYRARQRRAAARRSDAGARRGEAAAADRRECGGSPQLLAGAAGAADRRRGRRGSDRGAQRPGRPAADRRRGERPAAGGGVRHRRQSCRCFRRRRRGGSG